MASRIFIELLLFLTPFMVFLVYRAASRDMLIRDRWPLTTLVIVGVALAASAMIIAPLLEPSQNGKCFTSAGYIDGKAIPVKEIPCSEQVQPGVVSTEGTTPATAPVAPRDRGTN